jgi:hypothetical protein
MKTVTERLEKIAKKHQPQEEPCNICGCPREVTFAEQDKDTGKTVTRTHIVECGSHQGIPTYLWNKVNKHFTEIRPTYDDYQKFFVRQKTRTTQEKKERV